MAGMQFQEQFWAGENGDRYGRYRVTSNHSRNESFQLLFQTLSWNWIPRKLKWSVNTYSPTSDPDSFDKDATDLARAGRTLADNTRFMGLGLGIISKALEKSRIEPGSPAITLLHKIAIDLSSSATCLRDLIESLYELDIAIRLPPVSKSKATETLSKVDGYLLSVENSARAVHFICRGNALPRTIYGPHNPIPILCECIRWIPATVALWRELVNFSDVLVAMDGLITAARTLRRFLKQAIDTPARFTHNQNLMGSFFYAFRIRLQDGLPLVRPRGPLYAS
ncbi:hypothetical protein B0H11DRAFT_1937772 [Mycena galericulata]|nr:hypothetical protein B0H11DRAFT_1937772 [Mycena galericulata]